MKTKAEILLEWHAINEKYIKLVEELKELQELERKKKIEIYKTKKEMEKYRET